MPVRKRSYSIDEKAASYLDHRAKRLKRSASSLLSEIVLDASQQEARDRALAELGEGVEISEKEIVKWQKALGLR